LDIQIERFRKSKRRNRNAQINAECFEIGKLGPTTSHEIRVLESASLETTMIHDEHE